MLLPVMSASCRATRATTRSSPPNSRNFGSSDPHPFEEIAPAYVFLAAPSCSSYITGEILPIVGGQSGG
jgi:NAD(P)-dependent dehydrogenase (short-subunit alcohol dehydrogenase family)